MRSNYSPGYLRRVGPFLPLLIRAMKTMSPERFLTLAESCLTCDTYGRLGEIRCPVLVLGGGRDRIVTADGSREIAGRLGCEIHIYENGGHSVYEEQAKDFNRRVSEFFSRT